MPDGVDFTTAAALPVAAGTALQALVDHGHLRAGERVLVTGAAGGVGHYAIQVAAHFGAFVVGVCGTRNAEFVRGLGAHEVVDYSRDDFTRRADRFDVVFDAASASSFLAARAVLAEDGLYISTAGTTAAVAGTVLGGIVGRLTSRQRALPFTLKTGAAQWRRWRNSPPPARCGRTSSARSRSPRRPPRLVRWKRGTGAARRWSGSSTDGMVDGAADVAQRRGCDVDPRSLRSIAMERTLTALLTVVLLAGCASHASQQASTVRNGDPATVNRDCKLLGTVSGRSVFGGDETARGEGAIADARAKAAAMGATDIVFLVVDTSGMLNTGRATARAYRCDRK